MIPKIVCPVEESSSDQLDNTLLHKALVDGVALFTHYLAGQLPKTYNPGHLHLRFKQLHNIIYHEIYCHPPS